MKTRLLFSIAAITLVLASASFATDSLRLLAKVSHLQAQEAGEDLEQIANKQKDLIAEKTKLRQLQEAYEQALDDNLQGQDPELGHQLQVLLERFKELDEEWNQIFGKTVELLAQSHKVDLDNVEPEEEELMGATGKETKAVEGEEEEEMPMLSLLKSKARFHFSR